MDLQLTITSLVILAAALFVGRAIWQTWRSFQGKGACGGGGCGKTSEKNTAPKVTFIPLEKLQLRHGQANSSEDRYEN